MFYLNFLARNSATKLSSGLLLLLLTTTVAAAGRVPDTFEGAFAYYLQHPEAKPGRQTIRLLKGYCHVLVGGYLSETVKSFGGYFKPLKEEMAALGLEVVEGNQLYLSSAKSVAANVPLLREKLIDSFVRCGGDKKLLVFGHSMGGTTPTALAIQHPEDVGAKGYIKRVTAFQSPIQDMHTLDHQPLTKASNWAVERGINLGPLSGGASLTGEQINGVITDRFDALPKTDLRSRTAIKTAVRFLATRSEPDGLPWFMAKSVSTLQAAGGEGDGLVATASMYDREFKFGYLMGVVPDGTPGMDHLSPLIHSKPLISQHNDAASRALYYAYLEATAADLKAEESGGAVARARAIAKAAARNVKIADLETLNRPSVLGRAAEMTCRAAFALFPRQK